MKRILLSIQLIFVFITLGLSQEVITFKLIRNYTKDQLKQINPLVNAKYDIDVYYIEYTTKKLNQEKDTASGIFSVPIAVDTKFPVLVYEHGTAGDRNSVPSKDQNQLLSAVLGTYGYICIFPDYIGLGISKGVHPYLHPESEAWATIDLVKAVKSLSNDKVVSFNEQIFVTGYSQGGHSAMACSRAIQEEKLWQVTACAPMSGPYSVSKEMRAFTLSDTEYSFCGYLGNVFLGAKAAYPDLLGDYSVESVFKPEYAKLINDFAAENLNLWVMNSKIIKIMKENGGKVLPKRMFIDIVADSVINNNHPINQALKRMDVCNWIPEFPMKMLYCKGDNQVTYRNAVYTDSLMNANGAEDVSSLDVFSAGDHSTCFNYALIKMLQFFGTYQKIETVGIDITDVDGFEFYPNPSRGVLNYKISKESLVNIKIINIDGTVVFEKDLRRNDGSLDISEIGQGIFFIVINGKTTNSSKLVLY